MNAKKALKKIQRHIQEQAALPPCRRNAGNVGGLKMLPTLTHGELGGTRNKNVPVANTGNRVNLDDYMDF